jgi:hypothetical protein
MTAKEAQKISYHAVNKRALKNISNIDKRIRAAAAKGQYHLVIKIKNFDDAKVYQNYYCQREFNVIYTNFTLELYW